MKPVHGAMVPCRSRPCRIYGSYGTRLYILSVPCIRRAHYRGDYRRSGGDAYKGVEGTPPLVIGLYGGGSPVIPMGSCVLRLVSISVSDYVLDPGVLVSIGSRSQVVFGASGYCARVSAHFHFSHVFVCAGVGAVVYFEVCLVPSFLVCFLVFSQFSLHRVSFPSVEGCGFHVIWGFVLVTVFSLTSMRQMSVFSSPWHSIVPSAVLPVGFT